MRTTLDLLDSMEQAELRGRKGRDELRALVKSARTFRPPQREAEAPRAKGSPSAVVKITRFSKTRTAVQGHISYLMRADKHNADGRPPTLEFDDGTRVEGSVAAARYMQEMQGRMGERTHAPSGRQLAALQALSVKLGLGVNLDSVTDADQASRMIAEAKGEPASERERRWAMNMVLSTPKGYTAAQVEDFARDFGREVFAGQYRYAFTVHTDRAHTHAHFVVAVKGADGKTLNPRKEDLEGYRFMAAEIAHRHGISLQAHRRDPQQARETPLSNRVRLRGGGIDDRQASQVVALGRAVAALTAASDALRHTGGLTEARAYATKQERQRVPSPRQRAALSMLATVRGEVVDEYTARDRRAAAKWIEDRLGPTKTLLGVTARALGLDTGTHRAAQALSGAGLTVRPGRSPSAVRVTAQLQAIANDVLRDESGRVDPATLRFAEAVLQLRGKPLPESDTRSAVRQSLATHAKGALVALEKARQGRADEWER